MNIPKMNMQEPLNLMLGGAPLNPHSLEIMDQFLYVNLIALSPLIHLKKSIFWLHSLIVSRMTDVTLPHSCTPHLN